MNITNTNNSSLARQISLDASVISRLRRGIRTPARNADYIELMARFFATKITSEYQKSALCETIRNNAPYLVLGENMPQDVLVFKWLCDKTKTPTDSLHEFMGDFINFQFKKIQALKDMQVGEVSQQVFTETSAFYGKKGKQDAVLTFLSLILKEDEPQTLYLFSDENIEWLTEASFTLKWAALMLQVIAKGNRIKIIHSITRNFDEMLSGIKEWMPLYMSGAITPYYYPKTQDGLFRHTFFIAPKTAAITSSSVRNNTENTPNLLHTDKTMLSALFEEYNDFLSLCRPLMRIFTPYSQGEYISLLEEFENEAGHVILKTDTLSDITMPASVAKTFLDRIGTLHKPELVARHLKRIEQFEASLSQKNFTEIITLSPTKMILSGKVLVDFSDMLNETPLFYTPNEYIEHLRNIIRLLKTYENYQVVITSKEYLTGSMIYVKEDIGVIIGKNLAPSIIFAINESNMVAAFWDYMNLIISKKSANNYRTQAITRLERLAETLETKL